VLDFWVDWTGVNLNDRHTELRRHVDVSKLPSEIRRQMPGTPGEKGDKLSLGELKEKDAKKTRQPGRNKDRGKGVER